MEYRGIVCEHCGKFLDFSGGLEGTTIPEAMVDVRKMAVVCLYCKETVRVSYDLHVRLISKDDADQAVFPWAIEDVHEKASRSDEELTDDEAREVLRLAAKHHDAEIGINWDVLGVWIDEVVSERKVK